MSLDPSPLPTGGGLFLTDGGIETTLIFDEGWARPCFAAFDLLRARGRPGPYAYYARYAAMASACGPGLCWKARPGGRAATGVEARLSAAALAAANGKAIATDGPAARGLRRRGSATVISGCVGPRGDGYDPGSRREPTKPAIITRADRGLCASGRRHGDGHHHDQRQRGRGGRTRGRAAGLPSPSPLRWRPTVGCRPGRVWPRRSRRSIRRPGTAPATT